MLPRSAGGYVAALRSAVRRGRWRRRYRRTLRSASDFERVASEVSVTDPRHPLFGQSLRLLSLTCSRGPAFVVVALLDGRRRLVRRAATSLDQPPPADMTVPYISVRALLPLARHIRSMVAASSARVWPFRDEAAERVTG